MKKLTVNHQFEKPDDTLGLRSNFEDGESLPRRIFIRIRKLMGDNNPDELILPGINAFNYGEYEEAEKWFRKSIEICPDVEIEIRPHLTICERVISTEKDDEDLAYERSRSQWKNVLVRWFLRRERNYHIRCKYCGHYTPYIDPHDSYAYLGQNNCQRCGRSYPTPDFSWDGVDGQAYIYYRNSVPEDIFYEEFEEQYDVKTDRTYFMKK
ncbi:MAG: hypothetical protein A2W28_08205 [Gammaproteobacteria bacterium RBG_16_51_14]|nr:MAG: hypothetical protein A2W28_08205 [Gammaproteobacteria bacterium RBG_16_51_14]